MASNQEKRVKEWRSLSVEMPLTEGVEASVEGSNLTIKGNKGEISRNLRFPNVKIEVKDRNVVISTDKFSKNEKKIIHTYRAHVNNMIKGVTEGFTYKLVVVYAKFPVTVESNGKKITVKNLLGEKVPRSVDIYDDVKVEVQGKDITVTGIDKERTGQMAALIEQLTKITHFDRRVIQDGIFITEKPHKTY